MLDQNGIQLSENINRNAMVKIEDEKEEIKQDQSKSFTLLMHDIA